MKPSNNLELKTFSGNYCRVHLVCMKVLAHSSIEPPRDCSYDQTHLTKQGLSSPLKTI